MLEKEKEHRRQQIPAHWPSLSLFILCSDCWVFFNALPGAERHYAAHHQISFHLTAQKDSAPAADLQAKRRWSPLGDRTDQFPVTK